jgi:hypothetical protein
MYELRHVTLANFPLLSLFLSSHHMSMWFCVDLAVGDCVFVYGQAWFPIPHADVLLVSLLEREREDDDEEEE